jgi:hypothetical protein
LGETSFGTGTVLNEFHLSDGSALLLATEEWLTPNGRIIWHQGITPDVAVALPRNATPLLPAPHLPGDLDEGAGPEAERGMTPAEVQDSGDGQLLRALDLLNVPGCRVSHPARAALHYFGMAAGCDPQ